MNPHFRHAFIALMLGSAVTLLSACSTLVIPVTAPAPSALAFESVADSSPVQLTVRDARSPQDRASIAGGVLVPDYRYGNEPLDPVAYLADHIEKELAARGFSASRGAGGTELAIRSFHFENHRVSGFSPWVALTTVSADVETPSGPRRIASFVRRAKVPVWSMQEINEPCFSDALSIATKELAAKLNAAVWNRRLSDADVDALVAKIDQLGETETTWLEVYQLGFSNNLRAVPKLVALTAHTNEYMRMAAISGLGTLGAVDQLDLLRSVAHAGQMWGDRAIALKAIGDLGTPEAKAFLDAEWKRLGSDSEGRWSRAVVALYQ
ncbi:MAG TPA: HEAT repeat domain-containing protein [Myxococcota bacterium]|nr:HEAT repeat domain-containing protein [Myxococcota bacterium]